MIPEVRAVADRLTWEGALAAYLASILPGGGPARRIHDLGWTVQQTYAHLARQEQMHADGLERLLRGEPLRPAGWDHPAWEAETARLGGGLGIPHWLDEASRQRRRLYETFGALDDTRIHDLADSTRLLLDVMRMWSGHYAVHAFDILAVTPELTLDPLLVNWLLGLDTVGNPALAGSQTAFGQRVRQALAAVEAAGPDDA